MTGQSSKKIIRRLNVLNVLFIDNENFYTGIKKIYPA